MNILPDIINRPEEAQKLLNLNLDSIKKLMEINRGEHTAYQKTLGLITVVKNKETYIFSEGKFTLSRELYPLDLEDIANHPLHVEVPPCLEIEAVWDTAPQTDSENLFGDTVRLFVNQCSLTLPKVLATNETLAYYGAAFIPENTPIRFPGEEFPLFLMETGENWFKEGAQEGSFGGLFLEYHHDQPHFHMTYAPGSYYLLAKWKDASKIKLQITAFELPPGVGIYTKKGAIHSDAAIQGTAIVGYMISEDFSVAFLRDNSIDNRRVQVKIS